MIFTQHYLGCLSQASYLIGDETTGRAVVVDPRRDIDDYLGEAAEYGLVVERVIETHIHADFLSGHLELAAATGAKICFGEGADVEFPIEPLWDGQRVSLGEVTLEILATPGHTPESICVVVYEHAGDQVPYGVLTGDTLFVGDVGRPDLSVAPGLSSTALAATLYGSLHNKLLRLPDAARVFPAHGAGSACGKNLSGETSSTIGEQRQTNYALQTADVRQFVAAVTEGQLTAPRYFGFAAHRNRELRPLLDESPPPLLGIDEVYEYACAGAVLLDSREPAAYASGHLRGAISVGLQGRFAEWAGNVLSPDCDIVLVGDPALACESKTRLSRVGFDRVIGQLRDLAGIFTQRPDLVEVTPRLTIEQLAELRGLDPSLQLVDVRGPHEAADGVIAGARDIPPSILTDSFPILDRSAPVVVYCGSGNRSMVAASVLRAAGFTDASDLLGGFGAWRDAGLPVVGHAGDSGLTVLRQEPLNCETAPCALVPGAVTPAAHFYIRNHFTTPMLDRELYELTVRGMVERPLRIRLRDLRAMPSRSLVVTLECAGNGRKYFNPAVAGEQWHFGAASTAEWTGVPLADLLDLTGPTAGAHEVVFRGADAGLVDGATEPVRFERALSVDDARNSGALVAYAMNGEPLPLQQGRRVRLIVPTWYAVASVKWLTQIEVIGQPFDAFFQTKRYSFEWERDGTIVREPVRLQRVRALIAEPVDGESVRGDEFAVRGVAWSGAAPGAPGGPRLRRGVVQTQALVHVLAHVGAREAGLWHFGVFGSVGPLSGQIGIHVEAVGQIPFHKETRRRANGLQLGQLRADQSYRVRAHDFVDVERRCLQCHRRPGGELGDGEQMIRAG
jgi:DMSO/TMAO reductase YedYZ molybdopterin-dependent catalytic subunit/glyoxylase-like metal-dependent hydrolase (beta-lactamase superfamily II)/rhodanese-related sulfurtransferase